jgi:hypothetical protein
MYSLLRSRAYRWSRAFTLARHDRDMFANEIAVIRDQARESGLARTGGPHRIMEKTTGRLHRAPQQAPSPVISSWPTKSPSERPLRAASGALFFNDSFWHGQTIILPSTSCHSGKVIIERCQLYQDKKSNRCAFPSALQLLIMELISTHKARVFSNHSGCTYR